MLLAPGASVNFTAPGWMDAIWPEVQAALRADTDDSAWRRALLGPPGLTHSEILDDRHPWREIAGSACSGPRAALTVWWWHRGGELGQWPTLEQLEAAATGEDS